MNGYWKRKEVFTVNPILCFGNAKDVILQRKCLGVNVKEFYDNLKMNGQRFGGYYLLIRPVLVIADLDLVNIILIKDFDYFSDRPLYANEKDLLSANIVALKGERWKKLKSFLNPAFSLRKLQMSFGMAFSCCKKAEIEIREMVQQSKAIDILDIIIRLNLDIIGTTAFGVDVDSAELQKCGRGFLHAESVKTSLIQILAMLFPEMVNVLKLKVYSEEMTEYFVNFVKQVIQYRKHNNIVRNDLMQSLLQLMNGEDGFSVNEIVAHCFAFLLGGFETPSSVGAFCIYELSINQHLQDKVRKEIEHVLETNGGEITYNTLCELKFMDQCISETLRKYPSTMVLTRVCTRTYQIPNSNVTISKGTPLIIPVYGIQMDPDYYPNPNQFDPERFSEENKGSRPSTAWLPFGDGPRMCIAPKLGFLQIKMALFTLLRNYKFVLHPSTKVPMPLDTKHFLMSPASKILVNAEEV